jgi:malate dehydrogenase (oxaloacetate-decarboxylating)(NADP+)
MAKKTLTDEEIFSYHLGGKIGLDLLKNLKTQRDLSTAYTPGVGKVCKAIEQDPEKVWSLTAKNNLVAVVTDGTAVLGFGNIGADASIPVMEGKCALFKTFANVSAWPVPLKGVLNNEGKTDIEKFISTAANLACMYGGINLEDIAAPACFEIEDRLDKMLDIPVFHDDQWGTAVIVLAALKNYCLVTKKDMKNLKVVINGAGAAGLRIADMIKADGVQNCIICDSKGTLNAKRTDINKYKQRHVADTDKISLKEVMKGADVFIGVSVADAVNEEMVQSMGEYPAIFAMANPAPEILPEKVKNCMKGRSYVMATGRSDYPNQVNNVLGFPFIFRGALDVRATTITMNMKVAASNALAKLAREPQVPEKVKKIYKRDFVFGPEYLIPTPFDARIMDWESKAVAEAAIKDGVSRVKLPLNYS